MPVYQEKRIQLKNDRSLTSKSIRAYQKKKIRLKEKGGLCEQLMIADGHQH